MGNGHEAIECRPANDGVEREVHLRNIEQNALCAEVLLGPAVGGFLLARSLVRRG